MNLRERIIKRNNINIIGSGNNVVMFAHGFGCDQRIWDATSSNLLGTYTIVLFDYVGSGHSQKDSFDESRYQSIHGYAEDVIEIIEALDLQNVTLVGHSISGAVGYLVALAIPERLRKLIAISPSACYLNDPVTGYQGGFERNDIDELFSMMEHNFYEWAGFLAPQAMNQPDRPELANELAESFRATEPRILQSFARATFLCDVRALLPQVQVPVVLLYGSADMVVPESAIRYQLSKLPKCKGVQLEVKGHYPHVSEPGKIATEIEHQMNSADSLA